MKIPTLVQAPPLSAAPPPRTGILAPPPAVESGDAFVPSAVQVTSPWTVPAASAPACDPLATLGQTFTATAIPSQPSLARRIGLGVLTALSMAGAAATMTGCTVSAPADQGMVAANVLPLVKESDPVLHQRAAEVTVVDDAVRQTLNDMARTMHVDGGVGLAAPQVGISQRLIVVRAGHGLVKLVNPTIVSRDGDVVSTEGCLSIPDRKYTLHRATHVVVEGLDENGNPVTRDSRGLEAVALQHEIDHLDGVLISDRGKLF